MSIDATETSVSVTTEEKAQKQNNAVVASEVEAAATATTETAAAHTEIELKPDDAVVEPVINPRDEKMAKISANRKKQMEQGSQPELSNDDLGLPDDYQDAQGGTVTLKVRGKEKDFSAEKVMDAGVRALQKESTADVKLEEAGIKESAANVRMDQLDAREQNLLKREQEFTTRRESGETALSASADVSRQDELSDDEADGLVDDLYSGDREKAREAVKELQGRGHAATAAESPPVTAEQVAAIVERKSQARTSLDNFHKAYPGIQADANLQHIVNAESIRIGREHPEYSMDKLLMESGKYVSAKYGSRVADDSGFQKKAARKAQTDTVAGADVTRMPAQEKEPITRKQVVANLMAGRR